MTANIERIPSNPISDSLDYHVQVRRVTLADMGDTVTVAATREVIDRVAKDVMAKIGDALVEAVTIKMRKLMEVL